MKVNIIGAGVAGLSAGCYLQMNGFETEIFERHSTFGGLCTSWKRGGYTFESGLQWVLGSGKSNPFYLLWSELIDMDSVRFVQHEVRMEIEVKENHDPYGDNVFHLFTNLERLEKYLLSIAPEDEIPVRRLIRTMRRIQLFEIPPMIREVPELMPWHQKIRFIKHMPLLLFLHRIKGETNFTFADKLKNHFLKEAFQLLFDGDEMPLLIITMPLAFNDLKGTGSPVGGSVEFIGKIEQKYFSLGGKIRYSSEVDRIITENNHARGVVLKTGESIPADITISAADWHFTLFHALEGKYKDDTIVKLNNHEKLKIYYSVFMVSIGIAEIFENQSHFMRFALPRSLTSPDGSQYERMEIHINNYDPTSAPKGKTVISVSFYSRNANYWINLRNADYTSYLEQKQHFADLIIDVLETRFAGFKAKIEVIDVATPATYHRYTNNWHGSVQGWLPGKNIIARSPVKNVLPGLKDFYFIGHWTIPGGGLPVAIKSARDVSKIICHNQHVAFKIKP